QSRRSCRKISPARTESIAVTAAASNAPCAPAGGSDSGGAAGGFAAEYGNIESPVRGIPLSGWRPGSHGCWLSVLALLSRTAPSARLRASSTRYGAAASGGLRSLTRGPTRTECYPCDQGRFLVRPISI